MSADMQYPELPEGEYFGDYTAEHMRSFADATCALRGAQKESGWISVEERMPDTEDEVLVLTKHGVVMDRWRMQREAPLSFSSATIKTGVYWDNHEFEEISHWMAIPSPPTPEGEAK